MDLNKLVQYLFFLALVGILLNYVKIRYDVVSRNMIATSTTKVERTNFRYPTITICGFIEDFEQALNASPWVLHAEHSMTTKKGGSFTLKSAPRIGIENQNSTSYWQNRIEFTTKRLMFYCNQYFPPQDAWTPVGSELELHLNTSSMLTRATGVFIGATALGGVTGFNVFGTNRVVIEKARHNSDGSPILSLVSLSMAFGKWMRLPNHDRPCLSRNRRKQDLQSCLDEHFATEVPCFGAGGSSVMNCSQNELIEAKEKFAMYSDTSERKFIEMTGCIPSCQSKLYKLSVELVARPDDRGSEHGGDTIVTISVNEPVFTFKSDYEVYSMSAMAGDVGGLAGILLGFSALSSYTALAKLLGQVANFVKKQDVHLSN